MIFSASENEVRQVREDRDRYVGDLEGKLKETEGELTRVRRQVRFLEGENRTKRSNAELEISRNAITVLGIALQSIAGYSEPKLSRKLPILKLTSRLPYQLSALSRLGR